MMRGILRAAAFAGVLTAALVGVSDQVVHAGPLAGPVEVSSRTTLADATASLAAIEDEEQKARAELEAIGRAEQAVRQRLIVRGRVLYRLTRIGFLPVGGGFGDFVEHVVRVGRARWALGHDLEQLQRTTATRAAVTRKLEELVVRKAPLELERQAAARARALLEEAEDRRRAFDRAFERSTGAGDYVAVYGGGVGPEERPVESSFRGLRGRLPFPLAGRAEVRVVRRQGAGGPGVEMTAAEGSPVRAVHPGRVAFADQYDPLGQTVILDHGDHYYTLLGGLGSIEVRVGDDLSAGARLGSVGTGTKGGTLYFEIRRGAATLDPKVWLGL